MKLFKCLLVFFIFIFNFTIEADSKKNELCSFYIKDISTKKKLAKRIKNLARQKKREAIFFVLANQKILQKESWLIFLEKNISLEFLQHPETAKFFMQYTNLVRLRDFFVDNPKLYSHFLVKAQRNQDYRANLALIVEVSGRKKIEHDDVEKMHQTIEAYLVLRGRKKRSQYSEHLPEKVAQKLSGLL